MTPEQVKKAAELQKEVNKIMNETRIRGIRPEGVHVDLYDIFEISTNGIDISKRKSDEYPYEFSTVIDGVKFFAISE